MGWHPPADAEPVVADDSAQSAGGAWQPPEGAEPVAAETRPAPSPHHAPAPHPEAEPWYERAYHAWLDSGTAPLEGALQGASFGFLDELGGAARAAVRGTGYEQERNALRAETDQAEHEHPAAYVLGNLGGMALTAPLLPGLQAGEATQAGRAALAAGRAAPLGARVAAAAGTGLGYGALQGLGQSRASTPGGVALDETLGGAAGAAMGTAAEVGQSVTSAAAMKAGAALRYLRQAGATAADIRRIAQRGPDAMSALATFWERLRRADLTGRPLASEAGLHEAAQVARQTNGQTMGNIMDTTRQGVDLTRVGERVQSQLDQLPQVAEAARARNAAYREMEGLVPTDPNRPAATAATIPAADAHQSLSALYDSINYDRAGKPPLVDQARRGVARALRSELDDAVSRASQELGTSDLGRLNQAREAYGTANDLRRITTGAMGRRLPVRGIGLMDAMGGLAGLSHGSTWQDRLENGVLGAAAMHGLRRFGPGVSAEVLGQLGRAADSVPALISNYGRTVATSSAERGAAEAVDAATPDDEDEHPAHAAWRRFFGDARQQ